MSIYLKRYAYPPLSIAIPPLPNTGLIVVVPVFNEQHTLTALNSILVSKLPDVPVEVLIIINQPTEVVKSIENQNKKTFTKITAWIKSNHKKGVNFYVTNIELPKKHAGVGLARKAGMDEAVRRFELIGNEQGVILCFDADCTCSTNYLQQVFSIFTQKKLKGASVYYQHNFDSLTPHQKEGIIQYELHLRYYVHGLRIAGYPYAFHTVGSSMAVRTDIYKKAGGMNKRKAGEDFHFLHKVIPYGKYEEINTTTIFPSARISDRVPFGTGKAMENWTSQHNGHLTSYNPAIFTEITLLLKLVPRFYKNPNPLTEIKQLTPTIQWYLKHENFENILVEINRQSSHIKIFIHRWFGWFNGLRVLHLVHFLRDNKYSSFAVNKAAAQLISYKNTNSEELLWVYRQMDKEFTAAQISLKHLYSEYL